MNAGERLVGAVPGDWADDAACKGKTAVFYPVAATSVAGEAKASSALFAAAKRICASCPVVDPCREFALGTGETHGVFGGMDPGERRRHLATAGARP